MTESQSESTGTESTETPTTSTETPATNIEADQVVVNQAPDGGGVDNNEGAAPGDDNS